MFTDKESDGENVMLRANKESDFKKIYDRKCEMHAEVERPAGAPALL